MNEQRALLFATDFGAAALAARAHVELLARTLGLPVRVAHVGPAHRVESDSVHSALEGVARELSSAGLTVAGVDTLTGSAAEALIHHADATGCDWIVVGASRERVGGTVATVTRFARQAVWVSRAAEGEPVRRVVCGIDGTASSRIAAEQAAELCRKWGASLELVCATEKDAASQQLLMHEFIRPLELAVDTQLVVENGRARDALLRAATNHRADLLVLGRVGLHGLRRTYLGGTAEQLLHHSPCSMLLTSPSETPP